MMASSILPPATAPIATGIDAPAVVPARPPKVAALTALVKAALPL